MSNRALPIGWRALIEAVVIGAVFFVSTILFSGAGNWTQGLAGGAVFAVVWGVMRYVSLTHRARN